MASGSSATRQLAERQLEIGQCRVAQHVSQRPLPDHLPRQTRTYQPREDKCPGCGGALRKPGEDVSEILEYVPARFKVSGMCVQS